MKQSFQKQKQILTSAHPPLLIINCGHCQDQASYHLICCGPQKIQEKEGEQNLNGISVSLYRKCLAWDKLSCVMKLRIKVYKISRITKECQVTLTSMGLLVVTTGELEEQRLIFSMFCSEEILVSDEPLWKLPLRDINVVRNIDFYE